MLSYFAKVFQVCFYYKQNNHDSKTILVIVKIYRQCSNIPRENFLNSGLKTNIEVLDLKMFSRGSKTS